MKSNSPYLISIIVLIVSTFANSVQAAPSPKPAQDVNVTNSELNVNVTNTEAHQPIVIFASGGTYAEDYSGTTGFNIDSPRALLSTTIIIDFDPTTSTYCNAQLKLDVLDTPAGYRENVFVHRSYAPETIHHTFTSPILLTEDLGGVIQFVGDSGTICYVQFYITLADL